MMIASNWARHLGYAAAGVFAFALAAPAVAQGYGGEPNEEIEVIAPRMGAPAGELPGGLPGRVSLSAPVHYGDLDLRTRRGAHMLRARVRHTAEDICYQLDAAFPETTDDHRRCFENASHTALTQADAAIQEARAFGYDEDENDGSGY